MVERERAVQGARFQTAMCLAVISIREGLTGSGGHWWDLKEQFDANQKMRIAVARTPRTSLPSTAWPRNTWPFGAHTLPAV